MLFDIVKTGFIPPAPFNPIPSHILISVLFKLYNLLVGYEINLGLQSHFFKKGTELL